MMNLIEELASAPLLLLAIVVLPLVGFPAGALWVLAGSVLGPLTGGGVAVVGLLGNLIVAHRVSHLAGRIPLVQRYYRALNDRLAVSRLSPLDTILLVRTIPGIPLFIQNYFLGSLKIPFVKYIFVSMIIQSCYAISFVLVGASLRESNWVTSAGVVVGVALLSLALRRFARTRTEAPAV